MSNAYVARFSGMHKAALPLPRRRKFALDFIRIFSTCASPYIYSSSPFIYPLSPVLSAHITASDAPQRSDEWFALRKDKLTTSTFSTALGIWKGNRRCELWYEKVFALDLQVTEASKKGAMEWGVLNESTAIERWASWMLSRRRNPGSKVSFQQRKARDGFAMVDYAVLLYASGAGSNGDNGPRLGRFVLLDPKWKHYILCM